ncbi:hypothetical protein [Mediterraneibacter gnavus]|uniref:hypothetical protein n=1 Tax=Mediterraneibacter gnavus TaxID=33038 RepID=UPI0036F3984A
MEIGDKVILVDGSRMAAGNIPQGRLFVFEGPKEHTITDIAAVHYVKSGTVQFMYELDGNGKYTHIEF